MTKALLITLPSAVNNSNLTVLGRIEMGIVSQGDKTEATTMRIGTIDSSSALVKLTLKNGNGTFYSDSGTTVSLGTSVTLTNNADNTVYLKSTFDDTLLIDNAASVFSFGIKNQLDWLTSSGFLTTSANSPKLTANYNVFKYLNNLKRINFSGIIISGGLFSDVHYSAILNTLTGIPYQGNWNNLLNSMSSVQMIKSSQSGITLDLNNINPDLITQFQMQLSGSNIIIYSGDSSKVWNKVGFFEVYSSSLTATMVNNLLNSLATTAVKFGAGVITIMGAGRTSASDAAIATLREKGFTVITNSVS